MLVFLFWLCWIADLLICLLVLIGKGFRESFGASAISAGFGILLFACTLGGLLLRLVFKNVLPALMAAALPLLILVVWYFLDKEQ